ncbi:ROK family protein [Brachybacterium muris]|uniref:ROK family protein n=1 Tax=Brachybacterium muris TaxID=219301 RepID=UPI000DB1FC70|nr:ROK family glucokinase [Brachybacterium muris]PZP16790.1 MAG: glucokinase [Brachybacterium faecium]MBM7500457.1 glucokinase [Brachybacterium muris]MCT1431365.1 ROK family protein [Brachybacterium muris]MCT1998898.1 ROK family protein [Brachybacterium muris]MCT2178297.1 ROK family protein [Brachybacterium muris]
MLSIGVDIGGTKIAAGVVDEAGTIIAATTRSTPATDPELIEAGVADAVAELRAEHDVVGVGVGAAGFVGADRRTVVFAANLAWRHRALAEEIERLVSLPVVVENDANAAGWAEFRFGAATEAEHMLMVTVGTGLGGAIVLNGELVRGSGGFAGEIAHMTAVPNGQWCGCGRRGCLEQYTAGTALVRAAKRRAATGDPLMGPLVQAAGGAKKEIDGPLITRLAQQGDPGARELIAEIGSWLGEGLASISALLDPEVIVVGGGVSAAGDLLLDPAREAYAAHLTARMHRDIAPFEVAQMGNRAGIVGAADLAR